MSAHDVVLRALDVLEAALTAGSIETAVEPVRLELEVLDRPELLRVAMAIASEATVVLTLPRDRGRMRDRLQRRRLNVMVMD
jgi:hypothetical protein